MLIRAKLRNRKKSLFFLHPLTCETRCDAEFKVALDLPSPCSRRHTCGSASALVRHVHGWRGGVGQQVKPNRTGCKVNPGPFRRHSHSGEVTGSEGPFYFNSSFVIRHLVEYLVSCFLVSALRPFSSAHFWKGLGNNRNVFLV